MIKRLLYSLFLVCYGLSAVAQVTPDQVPGLSLWMRSDQGVSNILGGFVNQWDDVSGSGNYGFNMVVGYMPGIEDNQINGLPAVGFYGPSYGNDYLDLNTELNSIRTVFWVIKENPLADYSVPRSLLGHHTATDFLRGPGGSIWSAEEASPYVLDGTTHLNMQEVDGTTTSLPSDYVIVSVVTTGPVSASSLTVDRETQSHQWWGFIAEVIVYDQALSPEEVAAIEDYLDSRYTPAFSADADVNVASGFCPVTICAIAGMDNYLWSTGETSQCIDVNNTGDYVVSTTDRFGRIKSDTVHVQYDGNTEGVDQLICYGDTYTWDLQLDTQNYSISWFDGNTDSARTFDTEGNYAVTITDGASCTLNTSLSLDVDSLPIGVGLGPDLILCSGNVLGLQSHSYTGLEYAWSTSATAATIVVESTDDYSVVVIDQNGCTAYDTVHVTIAGTAPDIAFTAGNACQGAATSFSADNISGDSIESWTWTIETTTYSGEAISHVFEEPGDYEILLHAITTQGCFNDYESLLHVYSAPDASIAWNLACDNAQAELVSTSSSSEGAINSWEWQTESGTFEGDTLWYLFPQSGFHAVELTVGTEYGCLNTQQVQVDVLASPSAGFSYSGTCDGELTSFDEEVDISESGPIDQYIWSFGDNTASFQANPSHYYVQTDTYNVALEVVAETGCRDTVVQGVTLQKLPIVDFAVLNACLGQPFLFQESVSTFGDPVSEWHWNVQGVGTFSTVAPLVTFQELGLHTVVLSVITEQGCTSSTEQAIPVWQTPIALFQFSPQIGPAPFTTQFTNLSSGGTSYSWDFGDGTDSHDASPQHTFLSDSLFQVSLVVTNNNGCQSNFDIPILVAVPVPDIAVQNLVCTSTSVGQEIQFQVVNAGNLVVHRLKLSWIIGNEAPVSEEWNGELLPGESFGYVFTSHFIQTDAQLDYLCADATELDGLVPETLLENNQVCKSLDKDSFDLFPPFPNPGASALFVRLITPFRGDIELRVVDAGGKIWKQWTDPQVESGFHQYFMDIGALADGTYRVEARLGDKVESQTFVKIRN